jgi:hypothetical protein
VRQASRILVSLVMMAVTVACGAGAGATASPISSPPTPGATALPTSEPTPTPDPATTVLESCAGETQQPDEPLVLEVHAKNSQFDTTQLEGPRHCEPFTIALTNDDRVWEHNVTIELMDVEGTVLFAGGLVTAPETVTYDVPALPAGEYRFVCSVHSDFMRGTIVVEP